MYFFFWTKGPLEAERGDLFKSGRRRGRGWRRGRRGWRRGGGGGEGGRRRRADGETSGPPL